MVNKVASIIRSEHASAQDLRENVDWGRTKNQAPRTKQIDQLHMYFISVYRHHLIKKHSW
jgi:hypothetical protein